MKNKIHTHTRYFHITRLGDFIWFNNLWSEKNKIIKHKKWVWVSKLVYYCNDERTF